MLSTAEAAAVIGVSPLTLHRWRGRNYGPPFVKAGHRCRYPADALAEWLTAHVRIPSAPRPA